MSEHERSAAGTSSGGSGEDAREERLRSLYQAVYPPEFPPIDVSEALRRRVAEEWERQSTRPVRRGGGWWRRPIGGAPAVGVLAAALLLTVVGLTLARLHRPAAMLTQIPVPLKRGTPLTRDGEVSRRSGHTDALSRPARFDQRQLSNELTPRVVKAAPLARPSPASRPVASRAAPGPPPQVPVLDDMAYVNSHPEQADRPWVRLPRDEWETIEAHVHRAVRVRDDFITIPFPRLASISNRQIAQAVDNYKREAAIVDPRLSHEVTCAFKATALSDLCKQLRSDTGVQFSAGPSVADEKVTIFCEKMPVREVVRQLSRPFGYTWLRSRQSSVVGHQPAGDKTDDPNGQRPTPNAGYRYELVQDLRSQLLEEELRNRDQNAALLDLDREMNQYRPYLSLSPEEALARAATAPPEEKQVLAYLAGKGWGPAQLYFQLSPGELAALRAGQKLSFNVAPGSGAEPLPPGMASNVIASLRDYRVIRHGDSFDGAPAKDLPDGLPPASVPEAQPMVSLSLDRSELGQLTLHGLSGFYIGTPPDCFQLMGDDDRNLAVGMSPAVRSPENAAANARFARDLALAPRVTIKPVAGSQYPAASKGVNQAPDTGGRRPAAEAKRITSADVLEALHRATGLPIVADYYTRLYPASLVAVQNMRLFDALNRLADTMRLRWSKDPDRGAGGWLQFRSADFYNDRLKEVPNRLLFRWAASCREHGALTLDDLIEISQLSDAQLDSTSMAEGARVLYGLEEWDLTRRSEMRPNWRFLASLTPEQRQAAQSTSGLPFTRMSLAQQQEFLTLLPSQAARLQSLQELSEASLQVDYAAPGEFQWSPPVPDSSSSRRLQPPPVVRARTRQAVLLAAQRINPQATEAQITPTEATLTLTYRLGGPNARFTPLVIRAGIGSVVATLPQAVAP